MDFKDNAEEATFRREVRTFINANLPRREASTVGELEGQDDIAKAWRASLGKKGWIAPHWPKEYGGAGMSVGEQFIFNEEVAEARAPQVGGMGVTMIGPTLILYGTDEQKAEHLPRITSGEVQWAQGYSEPGAGSDLASLQTRAVRDGDDYVVNGQKIWSSGAHRADWMFMLTRTDPDAPKHRGISMLLVDLKSPGIQLQPLIDMSGSHVFNQEYFDNVRVPVRNRVGDENRGWYVGAALLDFERSGIGASIALRKQVGDLVRLSREQFPAIGPLRTELAERAVEAEVARLISYRLITIQKRGQIPNYEASMNKTFRAEAAQRLAQTGMKVVGMHGNVYGDGHRSVARGRLSHDYLSTVSATIAAGTSEVNRNVIATRGLGLPRG